MRDRPRLNGWKSGEYRLKGGIGFRNVLNGGKERAPHLDGLIHSHFSIIGNRRGPHINLAFVNDLARTAKSRISRLAKVFSGTDDRT